MQTGLMGFIAGFIGYGPGRVEDIVAMAEEHPVMDAYWEDKVARLDRIDVPAYVRAGWNTALHSRGSIDGFRGIASTQKWLVAHREFEWPYFYTPENLEDLRRFFDRYLRASGTRPLRRAADRERADGGDMMSGAAEEHFCVIPGRSGRLPGAGLLRADAGYMALTCQLGVTRPSRI
jgi:hypothetical protein